MPLPKDHILRAGLTAAPVATIYPDDPIQVGDIVLVCEHHHVYWKKITDSSAPIYPPSVSLTGWILLGDSPPNTEDGAWIIRGAESIERDTGSTTADGLPSGATLDAYIRSQMRTKT